MHNPHLGIYARTLTTRACICNSMGGDNEETHDNGMPVMDAGTQKNGAVTMSLITAVISVITAAIGYGIVSFGDYDKKIDAVVAQDQHYVFAALVVLARVVSFVNSYPMVYKSKIMKTGNLRSNMFIYKVRACTWPDATDLLNFFSIVLGNWKGCTCERRDHGSRRLTKTTAFNLFRYHPHSLLRIPCSDSQ